MKKKIFIIHRAVIVREGLRSIIKDQFNIEVISVQSVEEISVYRHISGYKLILFYEDEYYSNENPVDLLGRKNDLLPVCIAVAEPRASGVEHYITLKSGPVEILDLVRKGLNLKEKNTVQPEGTALTRRETEVLKLVASGFSNKKIAEDLFISTHTVISHRKKITEKTGIKSISGLTVYAILNGLIDAGSMNPEDLI